MIEFDKSYLEYITLLKATVDDIEKSFSIISEAFLLNKIDLDTFEKAQRAYMNNAENRRLKRVGKPYGSSGQEEPNKDTKEGKTEPSKDNKEPEKSLEEHAKEASEADLQRTVKEGKDAELRQVAHEELDRRTKEEHVQEEKTGQVAGQDKKEPDEDKNSKFKVEEKDSKLYVKNDIGEIQADIEKDGIHVFSSAINQENRGKGYGKKMYEALIEEANKRGVDLHSYHHLDQDSLHVWQSLAKKYNVEQNPKAKVYFDEMKKRDFKVPEGVQNYAFAPDNEPVFTLTPKKEPSKAEKTKDESKESGSGVSKEENIFSSIKLKDPKEDIELEKDNQVDFELDLMDMFNLGYSANPSYKVKNDIHIRVKNHSPNWSNFIDEENDKIPKAIINITVGDNERKRGEDTRMTLEEFEKEYPDIKVIDLHVDEGDSLSYIKDILEKMIERNNANNNE